MSETLLRVASLSKTFGGEAALVDANLEIAAGEIRALLGANGSGKSTLVKLLAGYYEPDADEGEVWFDGELVRPDRDGGIAGVSFIHQDLGLVGDLSVIDNVMLEPSPVRRLGLPRRSRAERRETELQIERYGLSFGSKQAVRELSAADRTAVAVMRALRHPDTTRLLVLDEVTASLPPHETDQLLTLVRQLGCAVLFVSHRIEEILSMCHTATVLRSGRVVADIEVTGVSENELVVALTGAPAGALYPELGSSAADSVLSVSGVTGNGLMGLSFDVKRGEMLGMASADPSEASRALAVVFGSATRSGGTVTLAGSQLGGDPAAACRGGMQFVTDRLAAAVPSFTVRENLTVGRVREISGRWRLSRHRETDVAADLIRAFDIRPPASEAVFSSLSGGNQQKGVLARAMSEDPKILLLDDPTRGIDVAAKAAIYRIVEAALERGLAVLISSSDFEELASLCHRVLILKNGTVTDTVAGIDLNADSLIERCYRGVDVAASAF